MFDFLKSAEERRAEQQSDAITLLLDAIKADDSTRVRAFLQNGWSPNACIEYDWVTNLYSLEAANPINTRSTGDPLLFLAIRHGACTVGNTLLHHGADPNYPVLGRSSVDVMELSAVVHNPHNSFITPLLWALRWNSPDSFINDLLSAGAIIEPEGPCGSLSALWHACYWGKPSLAMLFLQGGANPNGSPLGYSTPLQIALTRLLFSGTPLNQDSAAQITASLLEFGADPNLRGTDDPTIPINSAIENGCRGAALALINHPEIDLDWWFEPEAGEIVKKPSRRIGVGPLTHAIEKDDIDLASCILAAGANPNTWCSDGISPLVAAINNNSLDSIQLLLANGAYPQDVGWHGKCALDYIDERTCETVKWAVRQCLSTIPTSWGSAKDLSEWAEKLRSEREGRFQEFFRNRISTAEQERLRLEERRLQREAWNSEIEKMGHLWVRRIRSNGPTNGNIIVHDEFLESEESDKFSVFGRFSEYTGNVSRNSHGDPVRELMSVSQVRRFNKIYILQCTSPVESEMDRDDALQGYLQWKKERRDGFGNFPTLVVVDDPSVSARNADSYETNEVSDNEVPSCDATEAQFALVRKTVADRLNKIILDIPYSFVSTKNQVWFFVWRDKLHIISEYLPACWHLHTWEYIHVNYSAIASEPGTSGLSKSIQRFDIAVKSYADNDEIEMITILERDLGLKRRLWKLGPLIENRETMHRWQLRPFTLDLATKLDLLGFRLTLAPRKQDGSSLGFEKIIVSDVYFGEIEISVEYLGGSQNFLFGYGRTFSGWLPRKMGGIPRRR